MPTPNAADGAGGPGHQGRGGGLNLRTSVTLLPTPTTTQRGTDAAAEDRPGAGPNLHNSVALLPTPAAQEPGGTAARYHERLAEHDGRTATFLPLSMAVQLLPTPVTDPASHNGHARNLASEARLIPTPLASDAGPRGGTTGFGLRDWSRGVDRDEDGDRLLPTPRATDGAKGGPNQRGSSGDVMLPAAVQPERWGAYAPAVARWEAVTGRPAPAATEPGAKGQPRLSAAFVEWLMGLEPGRVTDVPGVGRNAQLKALGNGVVPQQAAMAVGAMLADVPAQVLDRLRAPAAAAC